MPHTLASLASTTPESIAAFFAGLNSFIPILVAGLLLVIPLFLKLSETKQAVEKIAVVNLKQDVKLGEVIDLANGRLEQAFKLIAEVRSENAAAFQLIAALRTENAVLSGSLRDRMAAEEAIQVHIVQEGKAVEAQQIHDAHKAHADEARDVTKAATAATEAAVAAKVGVSTATLAVHERSPGEKEEGS